MGLGTVVVSDDDGKEYYICENPPSQAELEAYFKENGNGQDHMIIGVELASRLILQPVDDQKTALLGLIDQLSDWDETLDRALERAGQDSARFAASRFFVAPSRTSSVSPPTIRRENADTDGATPASLTKTAEKLMHAAPNSKSPMMFYPK